MIVCIRENYIDIAAYQRFSRNEELLSQPPYNYKFVECDKEDCRFEDFDYFNDIYTFNLEKYNNRKQKQENAQKILELKQHLFDTDYKAIQWSEGEITSEEFEPIRLKRKAWREEIRALEISINQLTNINKQL